MAGSLTDQRRLKEAELAKAIREGRDDRAIAKLQEELRGLSVAEDYATGRKR